MKIKLHCSTVRKDFEVETTPSKDGVVWGKCPYCDTMRRTKDDPGYDPAAPQPHPKLVRKGGKNDK